MPTSPEIRPPQVTFKTVFTISFGVLLVVAAVAALTRALVGLALVGTAAMIAISLEHAVRMLQRRGLRRSLSIAAVMLAGFALAVGFGFTLIPPAVRQGEELVHNAPRLVRATRESRVFRSLDARYHLAERVQALEQQRPEKIQRSATPILNAVGGALTAVGAVITIVFLVVFMLIFGGRLIEAAVAGRSATPARRPCTSRRGREPRASGPARPERHPGGRRSIQQWASGSPSHLHGARAVAPGRSPICPRGRTGPKLWRRPEVEPRDEIVP